MVVDKIKSTKCSDLDVRTYLGTQVELYRSVLASSERLGTHPLREHEFCSHVLDGFRHEPSHYSLMIRKAEDSSVRHVFNLTNTFAAIREWIASEESLGRFLKHKPRALTATAQSRSRSVNNAICYHCGRAGHMKSDCKAKMSGQRTFESTQRSSGVVR